MTTNSKKLKLFCFYLGGKFKNAKLEMHDIAFGVGETVEDCFEQIKTQWVGILKGLHIDAYMSVEELNGYNVSIECLDIIKEPTVRKDLYFINLGGCIKGFFGESHQCGFIIAGSQLGAMSRAKSIFKPDFGHVHTDNIINMHKYIKDFNIYLSEDITLKDSTPAITNCQIFVI